MSSGKDNTVAILAVLLIGAMVFYPNLAAPGAVGGGNIPAPNNANDYAPYTNVVTLVPIPVCVGDNVTLTINTNIPNGHCSLFASTDTTPWKYITTIALDADGDYTLTQPINVATGHYTGAAVCSDAQGNAKISNFVEFDVIFCSSPPPPQQPPQQPPSNQLPCYAVYNIGQTSCPLEGYCAIPEQTCTFIPATLSTIASCQCRTTYT